MADITNLSNFLGDVADAIRTKKGTTDTIPAANFDTEIVGIDTVNAQEKTVTPSTSAQTVTPDVEYNALSQVTVEAVTNDIDSNIIPENIKKNTSILGVVGTLTEGIDTSDATATSDDIVLDKTAYVNGMKITGTMANNGGLNYAPTTTEQTIPAGYTSGGTVYAVTNDIDSNIAPENIKKDVSILGITGTLEEGTTINNQDKTVTENGAYTADEGYTGLGTVTVNVASGSGDVKLFETEETMQADPSPAEGDLAVVYKNESQEYTGGTCSSITFPSTVVLDTTYTDSTYGMMMSDDGSTQVDVMLSASYFYCNIMTETEHFNIRYTSTDGITYTRTDSYGETIDLGIDVSWDDTSETFDATLGKFMIIGGYTFDGLFEYTLNAPLYNQFCIYPLDSSKYDFTIDISGDISNIYLGDTIHTSETVGAIIRNILSNTTLSRPTCFLNSDMTKIYIIENTNQMVYYYNNKFSVRLGTSEQTTIYEYDLSLNITETSISGVSTTLPNSDTIVLYDLPSDFVYYVGYGTGGRASSYIYYFIDSTVKSGYFGIFSNPATSDRYIIASNQFTLDDTDQLLPNIKALGKEGVYTGDGSVYNAVSLSEIINSRTGYNAYHHGVYVVSDNDISGKGLITNTNTGLDYYKNGICTRKDYTNTEIANIYTNAVGTISTTYTTHYVILADIKSNTSVHFYIFDTELNSLMDFEQTSSYISFILLNRQYTSYIEESKDGTKLFILCPITSTSYQPITVDLTAKIVTMTDIVTTLQTYNGMVPSVISNADDFYWFAYSGTSDAYYIDLYKDSTKLTQISHTYISFQTNGYKASGVKIDDYIYFGTLGHRYNALMESVIVPVYVYNISDNSISSFSLDAFRGSIIVGIYYDSTTQSYIEKPYIHYSGNVSGTSYTTYELTPEGVNLIATSTVGVYYNQISQVYRLYTNGTDYFIIDGWGYRKDLITNEKTVLYSADFVSNTDFVNGIDNAVSYSISSTGLVTKYEIRYDISIGTTDDNMLVKDDTLDSLYLYIPNIILLSSPITQEEYDTALTTTNSILGDNTSSS